MPKAYMHVSFDPDGLYKWILLISLLHKGESWDLGLKGHTISQKSGRAQSRTCLPPEHMLLKLRVKMKAGLLFISNISLFLLNVLG